MKTKIIAVCVALVILGGAFAFWWYGCRLENFDVTGCTYYTEDEMKNLLLSDRFRENTLYQYLNIRLKKEESIPFVEEIEIDLLSVHSIRVRIYEKDIIGCISYMGEYICFDKDGIMVGSVEEKQENVPVVTGIDYSRIVYNEEMETSDSDIFRVILNITQLLVKNELFAERVDINEDKEISIFLGDIRVRLGARDQYDEQISALPGILKEAGSMKGTLNMENYGANNKNIIFVKDE